MTKKIIIFIIIILVIFSVVWIASKYKSKPSEEDLNTANIEIENNTNSDENDNDTNENGNTESDSKIKEFDMIAKQFTYEPNTITVNKDDMVIINITTEDVPHSFTLPDFGNQEEGGINETLLPEEKVTIEFTADKSGEFVFGCDVACGSGHSDMLGKLIVK